MPDQEEEIQTENSEETSHTEGEVKEEEKEIEVDVEKIDPKELKGLMNLMASSVREMKNEITTLKTKLNEKPVEKEPDPDASEFHTDPIKHTRNVVRETMKEVTAPLVEEVNIIKSARETEKVITDYLNLGANPDLVETYRPYLVKIMENQPKDVNTLDAALAYLIGQNGMGRLKLETKKTEPSRESKETKNMSTPTSKSSPSIPSRKKEPENDAVKDLTESQKAYIRRAGMSLEEGAALINAPSRVDQWPRKKKEGAK